MRVSSIPSLLNALADNAVTDIVVANGTYHVSPAANRASDSLWIGSRFASRTNAVTVRAESTGGVTFDGGGATYFGGLSFEDGAHHQTWQGFRFAHGEATQTGAIVFGDYSGKLAPHHISLINITIENSVISTPGTSDVYRDHGIYFGRAIGGPHDLLIDGLTVNATTSGLDSAIHFANSTATEPNAYNVTVRNMTVNGTGQAILLWDATAKNIVVQDSTITGAKRFAVRYEGGNPIKFERVTSTGSGTQGYFSYLGANPVGVTFTDTSFR